MLPGALQPLLDRLFTRQKGIRDFLDTEPAKDLQGQTDLTFRCVYRIAHRKDHRQLAVRNDLFTNLTIEVRCVIENPLPAAGMIPDNFQVTKVVLHRVPRNRIEPTRGILRNSVHSPVLRRLQEGVTSYVLSNFNMLQTKMTAQDGRHLSVLLPEQMR